MSLNNSSQLPIASNTGKQLYFIVINSPFPSKLFLIVIISI